MARKSAWPPLSTRQKSATTRCGLKRSAFVQIIAVVFLVTVAIGGVAYVFLYPSLSGERKAEQRMQSVTKTEPLTRVSRGPQKSRRDLVESSLKDFDERHKKSKRVPISV
jgi:tight adherence protein B